MAEYKTEILLAAALMFSVAAAGLDFQVNVAPEPEASFYQPNSSYSGLFNATVTMENPGSVGCKFRIKGDIEQGNQEITRYSSAYRMWPGAIQDAEFLYLPVNYTGEVGVNLSATYCDRTDHLEYRSFNMTERIVPNQIVGSKTLDVNSSSALVSFDTEKAVLIPQEYPALWKVGSERVNNSRAVVEYEPTLFKEGESITYTVIKNGTVEGKTEVVLEDQEKWYEEIIRKLGVLL